MAVEYCKDCDLYVDLDYDVEHFPDEYWENPEKGKCSVRIESEEADDDGGAGKAYFENQEDKT